MTRLLLDWWDPLRVAETDQQPQAEYLHEADEVLRLLKAKASRSDLAAFLLEAEADLSRVPTGRHEQAAAAISDWDRDRE